MKIKLQNIIIWLSYLFLIVDTINGITVRFFELSISKPYKVSMIILMMFFFIKHKIFSVIKIIFVLFIIIIVHSIKYQTNNINEEIAWLLRYTLILSTYFFYKWLIVNNEKVFYIIRNIFFISLLIISFNIISGYLGYGYKQYSNTGSGIRGFFYAGNELNLVLLSIALFYLSFSLITNNTKRFLFFSLIFATEALALTSRTSIAGILLIISLSPIIKTFLGNIRNIRIGIFSITLILILFYFTFPFYKKFLMDDMNAKVRFEKIENNSGSILTYGGRADWANELYKYTINKEMDVSTFLFGYSYSIETNIIDKMTEIDIVDVIFSFGIIGVFIVYGFFIKITYKAFYIWLKYKVKYPFSLFIMFYSILLIVISITAGHVMFTGMPSLFIGLLFSLIYIPKNKIYYEKNIVNK